MLSFLFLSACLSAPESSDGPYNWQGWIYDDIPAEGTAGLSVGAVSMLDTEGNLLAEGTQPEDQDPGNWNIQVDEAQEVEIRISGPEQFTTVWRTQTPSSRAFWYSGSFFAVQPDTLGGLWSALAELLGEPLAETSGANLYGETLFLGSGDELAWTMASVTIYDGEGTVHQAITLSTDEDGFLVPSSEETGPVTAFTATGLAPGPIRLVVDASDGRSVVMDYNAETGDLIGAFAFTLPELP